MLFLAGCSYNRPPAGEDVKDKEISWSAQSGTVTSGTTINSNDVSRGNNATPERAKPILEKLKLPDGFQIKVFAKVPNARSLALAYDEKRNRQVVFVGNKDESNVYTLIDEGSDYTVDTVKTIVKGRKTPNGVAFHNGNLYVAQVSVIHEFANILDNLDNEWEIPSSIVYDKLPKDVHHGWKYIAFGPDDKLYIPVGAPCNTCARDLPYASIQALDLTSKELTNVAKGVRNTVGFSRHPDTKELWFTDNGRDSLGDTIPPDELNKLSQVGEDFGFPACGGTQTLDAGADCSTKTVPQVTLGAHVAALGMKFYTGDQFPAQYKNQVFIAEHGSRNSSVPVGYRVMTVNPETKSYEVFIDWWLSGGKTWGRPVDIVQLKDGSLLISDDYAGLVYRVAYIK